MKLFFACILQLAFPLKKRLQQAVIALGGFALLLPLNVQAQSFTAPLYQVVDRNHVNITSNRLSISQSDIAIGNGDLSLTHSIYGGQYWDMASFNDEFVGGVATSQWRDGDTLIVDMTVSLANETISFEILSDNSYRARKDLRYQLERQGDTYLLIKPDGTEVRFIKSDPFPRPVHWSARMYEIKYPNGFTVSIAEPSNGSRRITTNNGLELRYFYGTYLNRIVALNHIAAPTCDSAGNCDSRWPTSRYDLPSTQNSDFVFKLTDAQSRTTEYRHTVKLINGNYYKRLTSIKKSWETTPSINYQYRDDFYAVPLQDGLFPGVTMMPGSTQILDKAIVGSNQWSYQASSNYGYFNSSPQGPVLTVSSLRFMNNNKGIMVDAYTPEAYYEYNLDWANNLRKITYATGSSTTNAYVGATTTFSYDGRSNLTYQENSDGSYSQAAYPSCQASNRKYCNKPIWIRDTRGFSTSYEYHPESGQVARITYPAVNGVTPQTRYQYQPYYAWYRNDSGAIVQNPTPIYRLAQESICLKGNPSGNGCADPQDELITRYYYGQGSSGQGNNLWLRGVEKISAEGVLRTCYQYDLYGNPIAQTSPKARLTSCPQ